MAEVVTGEAVVLDLTVARFPSRLLAQLLDVLAQLPVIWFVAVVVIRASVQHLNQASAAAVYIIGIVFVVTGYPLIFETLTRGKSLGKLALGLRVVRDDGGPEGFRQALIRALSLTFIELWLLPLNLIGMPAGLITSMVTKRGKRLGDVFAGTFVIHERTPRRPDLPAEALVVPPWLVDWAQHLEVARLSDQTAAAASSYLRRFRQLRSPAREQLGSQLAAAVAAQVSPPPPTGTLPPDYLAAVLGVRREREFARLQARREAQAAQSPAAQLPATQSPATQPPAAQSPTAQPMSANGAADGADVANGADVAALAPTPAEEPTPGAGFATPA